MGRTENRSEQILNGDITIADLDSGVFVAISIINDPPLSPNHGDQYIVGTSPTGVWSSYSDNIARYNERLVDWEYNTPVNGIRVFVQNNTLLYVYKNSAWSRNIASNLGFDNSSNDYDSDKIDTALEEIDTRQITKEPTGFTNPIESKISFNDLTRTFTIEPNLPTYTSFSYYIGGHKTEVNVQKSVIIDDVDGLWYIHIDRSGLLTASQTEKDFGDVYAHVIQLYWDYSNKKEIYFANERQETSFPWSVRRRFHEVDGIGVSKNGFIIDSYILNGDGSSDSQSQFKIGNGILYDEGIKLNVNNSSTPTLEGEQKLDPIAYLPVYHQLGVNGTWRKEDSSQFPLIYDSINTCKYNYYNSVTSQWELNNVDEEGYFVIWVFATNNLYEPLIAILGQSQYIDPLTADANEQSNVLNLTGLPINDISFLYRCMFRTSTLYTNTPKAILTNIVGINIPNNLAQAISNERLTASSEFQTTSSSYVQITNFELTPQSGTYAVWFNADIVLSANNSEGEVSVFVGDLQISDSERTVQGVGSNFKSQTTNITTYGFNGTENINIRIKVTSGTFYVYSRSLILIRLGPA